LEAILIRLEALGPRVASARDAVVPLAAEEFDALVRRHQRRIYRVLLGQLRDHDAAETLTQECFLRAYQHRHRFRGESSAATWLVRIALNLAYDHAKSRRASFWKKLFASRRRDQESEARHVAELPDAQASPEQQVLAREAARAVWSAAAELPEKQRAVFLLRFVEDMTLAEIAESTGSELGTVKAHLHRALINVRGKLKAQELETSP